VVTASGSAAQMHQAERQRRPHGGDNDSIHHAHAVTAHPEDHPRLEWLYGARNLR